jgi:hypothetical protein
MWRSTYRTHVCSDFGKQAAVPAKSRRRLLPRPTAKAKSVRQPRSAAGYHEGWQHLSAIAACRVCQPHPWTARKRLDAATVGLAPGVSRWQTVASPSHRCRRTQACRPAASHLGHATTVPAVLRTSSLRSESCSTVVTPRSGDCVSGWAFTRPAENWQHRLLLLTPSGTEPRAAHPKCE